MEADGHSTYEGSPLLGLDELLIEHRVGVARRLAGGGEILPAVLKVPIDLVPMTVLPDEEAERDGDVRVIDESGEDYLFSADRFVAIDVPAAVRASLLKAAQG